jgi:hypothetical protein
VAALGAAEVHRLVAAPEFVMHLAAGDSLLHGRHFFRNELGGTAEGLRRVLHHHYVAEDTAELDRILGRQYHAVVGNPPYISPKDPAMRQAYREIFVNCYRGYGLGAPFTERFFDLAHDGTADAAAGFVGLILANNFMKREFGAKLIREVLPKLDLTHVVDCSGIAVPAHGTPTAILFGRNQAPVSSVVRTVRGVRGDPPALEDPANGPVWKSMLHQIDQCGSANEFIDVEDTARTVLAEHPWNMGGGGTADLQHTIERAVSQTLESLVASIGFYQDTHADEAFVQPIAFFRRHDLWNYMRPQVRGDDCRDWILTADEGILFPYDHDLLQWTSLPAGEKLGWFWSLRTILWNRTTFGGGNYRQAGRPWFDYHQFPIARACTPRVLTFAFVQTHNHFVFDRGARYLIDLPR